MDFSVTLIPYQCVVRVVRLTTGSVSKKTEEVFLFYSIVASTQRSGYVLPRAAPQGKSVLIREYLRGTHEINPRPVKHDLEERLRGDYSGKEECKGEMG